MDEQQNEVWYAPPGNRFAHPKATVAVPTTYPDEKRQKPVLYGPKGEPLYKPTPKFGYRVED